MSLIRSSLGPSDLVKLVFNFLYLEIYSVIVPSHGELVPYVTILAVCLA